jgi:hypothetical protein
VAGVGPVVTGAGRGGFWRAGAGVGSWRAGAVWVLAAGTGATVLGALGRGGFVAGWGRGGRDRLGRWGGARIARPRGPRRHPTARRRVRPAAPTEDPPQRSTRAARPDVRHERGRHGPFCSRRQRLSVGWNKKGVGFGPPAATGSAPQPGPRRNPGPRTAALTAKPQPGGPPAATGPPHRRPHRQTGHRARPQPGQTRPHRSKTPAPPAQPKPAPPQPRPPPTAPQKPSPSPPGPPLTTPSAAPPRSAPAPRPPSL